MNNASDIYALELGERSKAIHEDANIQVGDSSIVVAQKYGATIAAFAEQYFQILADNDANRVGGSILDSGNLQTALEQEIQEFTPIAITALKAAFPDAATIQASAKNLYELAGASKLASANSATRTLSTTMGLLWERSANISPHSINPELEFGLKITGIDLISKNVNSNAIEFQQLKTQKNTLTGSQKSRSATELLAQQNPVFCACFTLSNWTFNHAEIPRVSGSDFWSRIGIDYQIFESEVIKLILILEQEYVRLLSES